tara:strand:+ start:1128 stop:1391 length:264 start_codon:yes stop_codon:yes gene_type:complete
MKLYSKNLDTVVDYYPVKNVATGLILEDYILKVTSDYEFTTMKQNYITKGEMLHEINIRLSMSNLGYKVIGNNKDLPQLGNPFKDLG